MIGVIKFVSSLVAAGLVALGIYSATPPKIQKEIEREVTILQERVPPPRLQELQRLQLGAMRPSGYVGKLLTRLAEGGSETTFDTTPGTTPDGATIARNDIGDFIVLTVNPGADNEEKISATNVSVSGNTATWTIGNRGLLFASTTASSSLIEQHAIGETVIISNDDQFLVTQYVDIDSPQTILAVKTFSSTTEPRYNADPRLSGSADDLFFAPKAYVDTVATSGVRAASYTQSGRVQIATEDGVAQGSSTVADGSDTIILVPPARMFDATSTATSSVPVSRPDGKISQGYWDLTEAFSFTGNLNASATNFTVSSTNINIATTTFNGMVTLPTTTPSGNQAMSMNTLQTELASSTTRIIASTTVAAGSSALTITIPSGYRKLRLVGFVGRPSSGETHLRFNSNAESIYGWRRERRTDTNPAGLQESLNAQNSIPLHTNSASSTIFMDIVNDSIASQQKMGESRSISDTASTTQAGAPNYSVTWFTWATTTQITTLTISSTASGATYGRSLLWIEGN